MDNESNVSESIDSFVANANPVTAVINSVESGPYLSMAIFVIRALSSASFLQ